MDKNTVLITHCIDTEGPFQEPVDATFERLKNLYGIVMSPTKQNLELLQNKRVSLNGKEDEVAQMVSAHLLAYKIDWEQIREMLDRITSRAFRNKLLDSWGEGWRYNWHCVDHVGYDYNPRKRELGFHAIFDFYRDYLDRNNQSSVDAIHWHFHPMSTYREAHKNATSYVNSYALLYESLCRRIIDRKWFPCVFRAGFHVERPDSHLFLEQWVPFDISNLSPGETQKEISDDYSGGLLGDWRFAPNDWSIYHPHHDHYQLPGDCRRVIARIQNVLGRLTSINQVEMNKAFARAARGLPTVVGLTGHDFRELSTEVDHVRYLIARAQSEFPNVKFKYCEAVQAFRWALNGDFERVVPLELHVYGSRDKRPRLIIETVQGEVFGPQPFLAIKTRNGRYLHDNLDFSGDLKSWSYTFWEHTLQLSDIEEIGIAANDKAGHQWIKVFTQSQLEGLFR